MRIMASCMPTTVLILLFTAVMHVTTSSSPSSSLGPRGRVLYGMSIGTNLMEKHLPHSPALPGKETDLRRVLRYIVELNDIYQSLKAQTTNDYQLAGLTVILKHVLDDACVWMSKSLQPDFTCNESSFSDLKMRLELYDKLAMTTGALDQYLVSGNVTCA